jgi:quercetin dioxygenase-like cupin family protein
VRGGYTGSDTLWVGWWLRFRAMPETVNAPKRVRRRRIRNTMLIVGLVAVTASGTAYATSSIVAGDKPPQAKREPLGEKVNPAGAPGRTLGLERVIIPPRAVVPLHTHHGDQIPYIQSGSIRYHVQRGVLRVYGSPPPNARPIKTVRAGQTVLITAGQWVVESPGMQHRVSNPGRTRAVIYVASLLRNGEPPSDPVR